MKAFFLFALSLATFSVSSAEWTQGIGYDYEVGTGYKEDGRIYVWQRNQEPLKNNLFEYIKVLRAYDCSGGYFLDTRYVLTTRDGRETEKEGALVRITPQSNTADEINLNLCCGTFEEEYGNNRESKKSNNNSKKFTRDDIEKQVEQAKNNNPYLVHWEANDPEAWSEALRQDEVLRVDSNWSEKPYPVRFTEVVRKVRAIMPNASKPSR